jgi:hypothetical protein
VERIEEPGAPMSTEATPQLLKLDIASVDVVEATEMR